jgi:hypothetical protein
LNVSGTATLLNNVGINNTSPNLTLAVGSTERTRFSKRKGREGLIRVNAEKREKR